jgi:Leucine-rich repeat (LRR) protein
MTVAKPKWTIRALLVLTVLAAITLAIYFQLTKQRRSIAQLTTNGADVLQIAEGWEVTEEQSLILTTVGDWARLTPGDKVYISIRPTIWTGSTSTLTCLRGIHDLESLTVDANSSLDSSFLRALEGKKNLKFLRVHLERVQLQDFDSLASNSQLTHVMFSGRSVTDDFLRSLTQLRCLRSVQLTFTSASGRCIDYLPTSLWHLQMVPASVTRGDIHRLNRLSQLRSLECLTGDFDHQDLRKLRGLSRLRRLAFVNAQLDDLGIRELATLPELSELEFVDCKLPPNLESIIERETASIRTVVLDGQRFEFERP